MNWDTVNRGGNIFFTLDLWECNGPRIGRIRHGFHGFLICKSGGGFGENGKKDPFQSEKSVQSAFHPSKSAKIRAIRVQSIQSVFHPSKSAKIHGPKIQSSLFQAQKRPLNQSPANPRQSISAAKRQQDIRRLGQYRRPTAQQEPVAKTAFPGIFKHVVKHIKPKTILAQVLQEMIFANPPGNATRVGI